MKKGYFSHQICYKGLLLNKHILYLSSDDNTILSILPFQQEVSLTTFCEGVLFVVIPEFEEKEQIFIDILKKQLDTNLKLTVGNAILNNPIYIDYTASEGKKCLLYSVTSVNWSTERPSQPGNIEIIKIKI